MEAVVVHHHFTVNHKQAAVVRGCLEAIVARGGDCDMAAPAQHIVVHQIEIVDLRDKGMVILVPDLIGVLAVLHHRHPAFDPHVCGGCVSNFHEVVVEVRLLPGIRLEVQTAVAGAAVIREHHRPLE
jgi:hypothetical protein